MKVFITILLGLMVVSCSTTTKNNKPIHELKVSAKFNTCDIPIQVLSVFKITNSNNKRVARITDVLRGETIDLSLKEGKYLLRLYPGELDRLDNRIQYNKKIIYLNNDKKVVFNDGYVIEFANINDMPDYAYTLKKNESAAWTKHGIRNLKNFNRTLACYDKFYFRLLFKNHKNLPKKNIPMELKFYYSAYVVGEPTYKAIKFTAHRPSHNQGTDTTYVNITDLVNRIFNGDVIIGRIEVINEDEDEIRIATHGHGFVATSGDYEVN